MSRISVWILGDQLLVRHPALRRAAELASREDISVVMIESDERFRHLPYHRKKRVLLLSAMRHYALDLRSQGYDVDYRRGTSFSTELQAHILQKGSEILLTMAGAEYATRMYQAHQLGAELGVRVELLANEQFLVEEYLPYPNPVSGKRYVMEGFYRAMRRHYHVLVNDDGDPVGDRWNFDHDNRKPLPKDLTLPASPLFTPDSLTEQAIAEVNADGAGVGHTQDFGYATTHANATRALQDFIDNRLPYFGDYEDAMSEASSQLFHSNLALYLNIGLLTPLEVIRAAEAAYTDGSAPLNAVEGFIRQILGWREYIYWRYWQQMPGLRTTNAWDARRHMPAMFWGAHTQMRCIHILMSRLLKDGYTHHIERLMVITNFCMLAGIEPSVVADWFLTFYVDAYDWVVLPNVIGMGLHADDGEIATKPYISSANYINRMSDYCQSCHFDPKKRHGRDACPFNMLYWNFLITHEARLRSNPRMGPNVLALKHLSSEERSIIQQQAQDFLNALAYYATD